LDSGSGDCTAGGLPIAVPGSGDAAGGSGGACGGAVSVDGLAAFSESTVLAVGVLSSGVTLVGSSSSLLSSLSMFSSCARSCLSRSLAASISARCAARRASLSDASFFAASRRFFSSAFLSLPALTCSSSARSEASCSSRCFWSSRSWRASSFLAHC